MMKIVKNLRAMELFLPCAAGYKDHWRGVVVQSMLKILQKSALATGIRLSKGIPRPKKVVRRAQVSGSHKCLFSFLLLFSRIAVYRLLDWPKCLSREYLDQLTLKEVPRSLVNINCCSPSCHCSHELQVAS